MPGLSAAERTTLENIVAGRVGARTNAKTLVAAYLDAMSRNALFRTTDDGPVPTTLSAERSLLLVEISRQLERVIEDFEIQALMRVTASAAKQMREILIATYSDDAAKLTLAWSLREARTDGRKKGSAVSGTVIVFAAEDRRDGFVEHSKRRGIGVEVLLGDATKPWRVIVADTYPKADLP